MTIKQSSSAILKRHLEEQLEKQLAIQDYHYKKLQKLKQRKIVQSEQKQIKNSSPIKQLKNISLKNIKISSKSQFQTNKTKQKLVNEVQYENYKQQIDKQTKKFKNKSILTKSKIKNKSFQLTNGSMKKINNNLTQSIIINESITQRQIITDPFDKYMKDLGNWSYLDLKDEISLNLVQQLKKQQQKAIKNILINSDLSFQQMLYNHIQKLIDRHQQLLFKLQQKKISTKESKISKNKLIVAEGYTDNMKKYIEQKLKTQQ